MELRCLGRPSQGRSRGMATGNDLRDLIEIACPDEALVRDRAITKFLCCELLLLKLGIRGHARLRIAARQMERAHVQRMEAREGHELELVSHLAELLLESGDGEVVQLLF